MAAGAVHVDAQVVGLDRHLGRVVDLGQHFDQRKRCLAGIAGIERRQPDQAMHAGLGLGKAIRILAAQLDRRAFDTGLIALALVEQRNLEAAALSPAHVHAQHQLGPVLGVGAAHAGLDRQKRIAVVIRRAEQ